MKRKNFNIGSYLHEVEEQMLGFHGNEYESEINADGNNSYGTEMYQANGPGAPVQAGGSPNPYSVTIVNSTAGTLNARLFGYNIYQQATNNGSDVGITITPQASISYIQLISQVASEPFTTSLIRLQSTNTSQVQQTMTVTKTDAAGESYTKPIFSQNYISSFQEQGGIIDIPYKEIFDGNTTLLIPILASATLIVTFFPLDKFKPSNIVAGRPGLKEYGAPRLSYGVPLQPVMVPGRNSM